MAIMRLLTLVKQSSLQLRPLSTRPQQIEEALLSLLNIKRALLFSLTMVLTIRQVLRLASKIILFGLFLFDFFSCIYELFWLLLDDFGTKLWMIAIWDFYGGITKLLILGHYFKGFAAIVIFGKVLRNLLLYRLIDRFIGILLMSREEREALIAQAWREDRELWVRIL